MIRTHKITVPVAGAAGSGAGDEISSSPVNGRVLAIHLDYTTQPATCDVTVSTKGTGAAPSQTLLSKANANTDAWFYPRKLLDDTAGAALTAIYDALAVDDHIRVVVAQGDPGSVVVTLLVEQN